MYAILICVICYILLSFLRFFFIFYNNNNQSYNRGEKKEFIIVYFTFKVCVIKIFNNIKISSF
jgi:hypothetical protein